MHMMQLQCAIRNTHYELQLERGTSGMATMGAGPLFSNDSN
jgi:hypothetical protein